MFKPSMRVTYNQGSDEPNPTVPTINKKQYCDICIDLSNWLKRTQGTLEHSCVTEAPGPVNRVPQYSPCLFDRTPK